MKSRFIKSEGAAVAAVYVMPPRIKWCPHCRRSLDASEFYQNRANRPDGLSAYCKQHKREDQNRRNRERARSQSRSGD